MISLWRLRKSPTVLRRSKSFGGSHSIKAFWKLWGCRSEMLFASSLIQNRKRS